MKSCWPSHWCVLAATMLLLTACGASQPPKPPDPAQKELDRFIDMIAIGMWINGRTTNISAKPDASDEMLIAAAVQQLNNNPGPIKKWNILKKEQVGPVEFDAHYRKTHPELFPPGSGGPDFDGPSYLIALIDSDQGHKIIAINVTWRYPNKEIRWARMYNSDAIFSSPMSGFQASPLGQ